MKLLRILIVACAVSALGIVPAAASQLATANDYGLTARGIALGNAITAVEDDASLIFHNPAAMAKMDTGQINAGYLFTDPNLSGGPKGDLKDFGEGNNIVLTNMIINLRDFFRSKRPFNIGLSIALDDDGKSLIEFIDAEDEDGHFYRYGRTSSTMVTSAGLGITDWLYLGGGVYILLRGDTDFQVTTDLAGNTSNEGMALTATLAYSPIISAYLDFEKFNVGVAYHGENYGAFENINVEAEATVGDSPLTDLPMQLAFQDLYVPQSVAVGVTMDVTEEFMVTVDGTWFNWGQFDEQVEKKDLPRQDVSLDFVDIYVPRLGMEYKVMPNFPIRLGYSYQQTPMRTPGSDGNIFLDNDRHVGAFGIGYTMDDLPVVALPITFDATFFHQYLVPDSYKSAEGLEFESEGNVNGGVVSVTLRY